MGKVDNLEHHNKEDMHHNKVDMLLHRVVMLHNKVVMLHNKVDMCHNKADTLHNKVDMHHNKADMQLAMLHKVDNLELHNKVAMQQVVILLNRAVMEDILLNKVVTLQSNST